MANKIPDYKAKMDYYKKLAGKEIRKESLEYLKELQEKIRPYLGTSDFFSFTKITINKTKVGVGDFGIRRKSNDELLVSVELSDGKVTITRCSSSKKEVFNKTSMVIPHIKTMFV